MLIDRFRRDGVNRDKIDLSDFPISFTDLDSSGNGLIDGSDLVASFSGGKLTLTISNPPLPISAPPIGGTIEIDIISNVDPTSLSGDNFIFA